MLLTHAHDIPAYVVSKGKVACDGDQDVDGRGRTNAGANNTHNTARRIILDFIEN